MEHSCGPSLKSQKRLSSISVPSARMDANLTQILVDYPRLATIDIPAADKSCHLSPERLPESQITVSRGDINHSYTNSLVKVDTESVRNALARLADINTARELLLYARKYAGFVLTWFREVSVSAQKLDVLIEELEAVFHREIAIAIDSIGTEVEAESDIAVSAILQSHQRFAYPRVLGGNKPSVAESAHLQKILHLSRRTRKGFVTDPVCGSTREIISGNDEKLSTVLAYMDASEAIAHVLETLECGNRSSKAQNYLRFSGDQIAYLYGNKNAALQLWTLCQERESSVDALGRNLLHLVVQNSDPEMLRELLSLQGTYAKAIDAVDVFNVTPSEIAACRNDLECFSLLINHGAKNTTTFDKHGESLIELASRHHSSSVVKFMLERGAVLPVPSPEACEAVKSEDQQLLYSIRSTVESTTSSPLRESRTGAIDCNQLNSMLDLIQISPNSVNHFSEVEMVGHEACLPAPNNDTLSSYQISDGYDFWSELSCVDMNVQFYTHEGFVDFDIQTQQWR